MARGRLFNLLLVALLASSVRGDARLVPMERPGFGVDVPNYFIVNPFPESDVKLDAYAPRATDQRGLEWDMGITVRAAPNANPNQRPIDETIARLPREVVAKFKGDLLEGPTIEKVEIPGAQGARLMTFRTRERGRIWWHYDLYLNTGKDMYFAAAFLNGRAGSEVLAKDYPASAMLKQSLLSFRFVPISATQPAVTRPSSQAATAPAAAPAP